jgi:hypothetical protein
MSEHFNCKSSKDCFRFEHIPKSKSSYKIIISSNSRFEVVPSQWQYGRDYYIST